MARWRRRLENRDYFRGKENVERVRAWRRAHPGYAKKRGSALQKVLKSQPIDEQKDESVLNAEALQTLLITQPYVLIGIISMLVGTPLQTVIAAQVRRLHLRGEQILHPKEATKGARDDRKDRVETGASA